MTPTRRHLLVGATAAGFAALGGWYALRRLSPAPPSEAAVELLYGLTLPTAAGETFALSSLRGRTVVLNFWATWCPPCIDEMPELAELHAEIAARNATVVGIGIDSPSNIREFAEKYPFPYPLLVGGMGGTELSRQFGNQSAALPFTVVIDAQGRVVERKLGRIRLARLREVVQATLAGSAG